MKEVYIKKRFAYSKDDKRILYNQKSYSNEIFNSEVCAESYRSINNLVAAIINADISANILTEPDSWKSFTAQNGQLIEATHDYEDVDYDESSKEYMIKIKKLYQRN